MQSLITYEEALQLGEIEDHAEIEALVERAWEARGDRFDRSGWLDGETPRTPVDDLIDSQSEANFWNPDTQLRRVRKSTVPPRPDGASNRGLELVHVENTDA